jgi:murein DD-endopeptidase MepM/ murein hydrolase activator NlpD
MKLPITNGKITQIYGNTPAKINYIKGYHTGLDFVSTNRSVYNVTYGVVIKTGFDSEGWGNYAIVRGTDDKDIIYAHFAKALVSIGKVVSAGDLLGIMGMTGNATGVHLHFEVRRGGWQDRDDINAADYLNIKNELGDIETADPYEDDRQWVMKRRISDGTDPLRPVLRREAWAMIRRAIEGRE